MKLNLLKNWLYFGAFADFAFSLLVLMITIIPSFIYTVSGLSWGSPMIIEGIILLLIGIGITMVLFNTKILKKHSVLIRVLFIVITIVSIKSSRAMII